MTDTAHSEPVVFERLIEATPDEANYGNKYASWTPRLLKAAYNYQVTLKDLGGYAHGGKYMIQLLFDSTADLNVGIDMAAMHRIDHLAYQAIHACHFHTHARGCFLDNGRRNVHRIGRLAS